MWALDPSDTHTHYSQEHELFWSLPNLAYARIVFSQQRQVTDYYKVKYERLPIFCYSCGLVGHSTLVCPTPAERDAEGFLPYHGPHLSVPDERKNKAGTNSVQGSFSSGQGSWPGNGRNGQSSQARASAQPQGKDGNGEATSSGKPKRTRTRKTKVNAQDVAGKSLAKTQGDGNKRTAREGGALVHPSAVALKVKAYLNMILLHLYNNDSVQRCVSSSSHKWIPPPEGTVLVNVDAAVFAPTRHMGAGVVIRDHLGSFLAASRELFQEVTNPELAEARAVLHAIVFARAEGFSKVIISSDCASVIQRLTYQASDRSVLGPIVTDSGLVL
ncbi:hypothetical protein D1007_55754 [Hordeum vulgare]|nr:hypothetical protein D1007_55754 [Hordeum vulgare]